MARKINYNRLAPEGSFLHHYMKWNEQSETPLEYDFWTGLWVLSSALGRGIVVDRPAAPVFLNLFCILVAESGITRKSTAVRRANKMLRDVAPHHAILVEGRTTQEALELRLAEQTQVRGCAYANICIDELVKFLGRERYVQTLPTFLTDVYDCPELRVSPGTISRGSLILSNVFVTFLSASTPSWLVRAVNPDVIEGGFTSRVVFVVAEQPKRMAPWPDQQRNSDYQSAVLKLKECVAFANKCERIGINEKAKQHFERWYRTRKVARDPFRSSFQSREDGHALRLSALLAINDETYQIQLKHIKAGIEIITACRENGAAIFEGTATSDRVVLGVDALRDALLAAGLNGRKHHELTRAVGQHLKADEVRTVLEIMHELAMVQRFDSIQLGKGRPATIWRATTVLASSIAIDEVLRAYPQ